MSVARSTKFPVTLWIDEDTRILIDNAIIHDNLRSRGEVIIHRMKLADIFVKNLEAIKANPEALEKAMIEIDELRKQEKLGIYFESMSREQRRAISDMIHLIDIGQWQQTRLV